MVTEATSYTDAAIYITVAVDSDLEYVAQLEQQLFNSPWSLVQLQNSLRSNHWIWVAKQQAVVIGYLLVSQGGGVADLLTLGVDPKQQRSGIGYQLLAHLFDSLERERVEELFLEVRQSNTAALNLYRRCGFESVAVRKAYYTDGITPEDAQVMRKAGFLIQ